ncbi:MAG: T9SS type A sorting domain-containing protein [Bacteroidota bacterium]
MTANIFPDTICIDPVWLGPIIKVEKECSEDGVTFTIKNIGGDMNNTLDYIVIEDNIILREEPYQLAAGQSEQVVIEMAEGSVYHLSAEQDPLMPPVFGDAFATSTLLNCNNEDPFYSYYLWFADDDELLHTAEDCQENIGSFDPNDKAASPRGLGAANFLRSNVGLEYKIRFQNTGTDTAFTVVIEDEVSPLLDLSTIRPGTSSHDYEFNIVDRKIIFTFNNIMLPDSNVNEVASHGFVQFKIDQIADNPIGTVLRNSAAIFFDFNDPIITNEVKHIIDNGSFTTSTTLSLIDTSTPILVFPNPFENLVHFELNKTINGESFDFELFDVLGRSVFRDQFSGHQYRPSLGALSSGIYYYSVSQSGAKIDSGKLIKQ